MQYSSLAITRLIREMPSYFRKMAIDVRAVLPPHSHRPAGFDIPSIGETSATTVNRILRSRETRQFY